VYVHLPFCESVCYYCACNKVITRRHERADEYLDVLEAEIDLHTQILGDGLVVSQLHLGGGSPTFLSDVQLARLMSALRNAFLVDDEAELSIEVDPRTVNGECLAYLRARLQSPRFGVQDFDPEVQKAASYPARGGGRRCARRARSASSRSRRPDHGLPRQTPASFAGRWSRCASCAPTA
jgi:oxygen-independent coproporphyrinogen-3 oxidase